jgi:hypothetical protein
VLGREKQDAGTEPRLFSDTEVRKNLPEKIVARDFSRELTQRSLNAPQILGCELQFAWHMRTRICERCGGALNRREMPAARTERTGSGVSQARA